MYGFTVKIMAGGHKYITNYEFSILPENIIITLFSTFPKILVIQYEVVCGRDLFFFYAKIKIKKTLAFSIFFLRRKLQGHLIN